MKKYMQSTVRTLFVAGTLFLAPVIVGCIGTPDDTTETSTAQASITISDENGVLDVQEGTVEQLLNTLDMIPTFTADGTPTQDLAVLWESEKIVLNAVDGTQIGVGRKGNTLFNPGYEITRSPDNQSLEIVSQSRHITVDLAGFSDSTDRARILGQQAAIAFGALNGTKDVSGKASAGIVVLAVVLAIGVECVTYGQTRCQNAATSQCGYGNVKRAHMNCGFSIGADSNSVTYGCEVECYQSSGGGGGGYEDPDHFEGWPEGCTDWDFDGYCD
jgi:hypothetical protein